MNKKLGGDRSSLLFYITKHGETAGTILYNERVEKIRSKLKGRIGPRTGAKVSEKTKEKTRQSMLKSAYHNSIRGKPFDEIYGADKRKQLSFKMKGYVFTLQWFKDKHGDVIGKEKYIERNKNIGNGGHFKIYNAMNKNNYSKSSQELFWKLYENFKNDNVYFAELNHEYSAETDRNFDFVIKNKKKIIEFNGDLFHANPKTFKFDDTPCPYNKNKKAEQIWKEDFNKQQKAINNGYQILCVWYSDYINSKKEIYEKCRKFLSTF